MPASSSHSSARHRRTPPHRLCLPRHGLSPRAAPAAREASATHTSQTMVMRLLRHAAARGRQQALHRRVHEVADAGRKHARYERLRLQQQDAEVNGEPLSFVANLVRSEINEATETASGYTLKVDKCQKSEISAPCNLQGCSANKPSDTQHCEHLPKCKSEPTGANEGSSQTECKGKKTALPMPLQQPT